ADGAGLLDADDLLVLRHLGDLGLLPLLRAALLVAAHGNVRALASQLDQVLLGDGLRLLHARALLALLLVLGDVDELSAASRTAGHDRQLAHLANGTRAESATARTGPRRRPCNRDQRPRQDHRARRRWACRGRIRDLNGLRTA